MVKTAELNRKFKKAKFFVSSKRYNSLFREALRLGKYNSSLQADIRFLETRIAGLKNKYAGVSLRDPKTGRYLKKKK